jgi:hypothetical protein
LETCWLASDGLDGRLLSVRPAALMPNPAAFPGDTTAFDRELFLELWFSTLASGEREVCSRWSVVATGAAVGSAGLLAVVLALSLVRGAGFPN